MNNELYFNRLKELSESLDISSRIKKILRDIVLELTKDTIYMQYAGAQFAAGSLAEHLLLLASQSRREDKMKEKYQEIACLILHGTSVISVKDFDNAAMKVAQALKAEAQKTECLSKLHSTLTFIVVIGDEVNQKRQAEKERLSKLLTRYSAIPKRVTFLAPASEENSVEKNIVDAKCFGWRCSYTKVGR